MCLLRETGEEDGLLGQGVLKMCIETADAGLDLYLPFFIYEEYIRLMIDIATVLFYQFFLCFSRNIFNRVL